MIRPIIQIFLESVYQGAENYPLLVAMASAHLMIIKPQFSPVPTSHTLQRRAWGLCAAKSLSIESVSKRESYLELDYFNQLKGLLPSLTFLCRERRFERHLDDCLWTGSLILGSENLDNISSMFLYFCTVWTASFVTNEVLYFFSALAISVWDFRNVAIGTFNVFEVSNLLYSLSVAALFSRKPSCTRFQCMSKHILRSRFNITCSMTGYTADRMPLSILWSNLRSISLRDSSIIVQSSFADKCFMNHFPSLVIEV